MTLVLPALNGCLWHTRKVPKAVMPANVLSASPEKLVQIINQQYDRINALSASVTFTATTGGQLKGHETTVAPFTGYILLRKPESLRVIGYLPVVHSPAFDMASDGSTFKLVIPPKSKAIEGTNTISQVSSNSFENMRPYMFVDSMLIPKITDSDLLSVTGDTTTIVDRNTRKLELRPDYLLTVVDRQGGTNVLLTRRVIRFSRIDLTPVEEDIYGPDGQIQTQAIYGPVQTFGDQQFPGTITIKWPLQEQQILVTIQKLRVNLNLEDTTFQLQIPKGMAVQQLK
jgi:outer membrane lipoprotein-sorting protein